MNFTLLINNIGSSSKSFRPTVLGTLLLHSEYRRLFPGAEWPERFLTSHHHLVTSQRMNGDIIPVSLYSFVAWWETIIPLVCIDIILKHNNPDDMNLIRDELWWQISPLCTNPWDLFQNTTKTVIEVLSLDLLGHRQHINVDKHGENLDVRRTERSLASEVLCSLLM